MVHRVEEEEKSRDSSKEHQDAAPIPPDTPIVLVSSSLEEFSVKASTLPGPLACVPPGLAVTV